MEAGRMTGAMVELLMRMNTRMTDVWHLEPTRSPKTIMTKAERLNMIRGWKAAMQRQHRNKTTSTSKFCDMEMTRTALSAILRLRTTEIRTSYRTRSAYSTWNYNPCARASMDHDVGIKHRCSQTI